MSLKQFLMAILNVIGNLSIFVIYVIPLTGSPVRVAAAPARNPPRAAETPVGLAHTPEPDAAATVADAGGSARQGGDEQPVDGWRQHGDDGSCNCSKSGW